MIIFVKNKSMYKYIKTFYNDKKVILKLDSCNSCPLLKIDKSTFSCKCKYFYDDVSNSNTVLDMMLYYNFKTNIVYDYIRIPRWCALPSSLSELYKSTNTYRIMTNGLYILGADNDGVNLDVIDTIEQKLIYSNFIHEKYPEGDVNRSLATIPARINYCNCSLCGEEDSSVKRDERFGMCDCCAELSKNDNSRLNQAFINNFRLKRNIKAISKEFRIIKEIINIK